MSPGRNDRTSGQRGPKLSLTVQEIPKEQAVSFMRMYHYSKIMPRLTKHYLGFYMGGELAGVVTLGWGTQPLQTIRKVFPRNKLQSADYLEIGKCVLPRP